MSKKNNVNSDHYKVSWRGHPGEDILHEQNKQKLTRAQAAASEGAAHVLPGAQPGSKASHAAEEASAAEPANR